MPVVLTIAGSDSGGGAGIQADLKTFAAHHVFGTSALTAITAQNTVGVQAVYPLPLEIVRAQVTSVMTDLPVAAIKIGMLADAPIIELVAALLDEFAQGIPVVLDPVMVATSGDILLAPTAVSALTELLLPRATVLTPNAQEARHLTGIAVRNETAAREAAAALAEWSPGAWVLVKGGHWQAEGQAVDFLLHQGQTWTFALPHLSTTNTHGTGCTLSSAIAARMAMGYEVPAAVRLAKAYVHDALQQAPGLGHGHGPLRHDIPLPQ